MYDDNDRTLFSCFSTTNPASEYDFSFEYFGLYVADY